jgi:hypothetical protein
MKPTRDALLRWCPISSERAHGKATRRGLPFRVKVRAEVAERLVTPLTISYSLRKERGREPRITLVEAFWAERNWQGVRRL